MKEFKYFQFASPFNSSRVITTTADVDRYWDESRDMDTGRSWQFFDDNLLHYVKYNNDSPSGYQGKSDSPIIPIDIDNPSTTNLKNVLNKLGDVLGDLDYINLYYSGKKGYHIEIPSSLFALNPSDNLPERMKRMVSNFDIGADLSLYKNHQLWRLPNSLNVSGGCYKTMLDISDIWDGMNINEIRHLANKPSSESFDINESLAIELMNNAPTPHFLRERDWLVDIWEQTECPDNTKLKVSGGVKEGYRNGNAYDTALSLKTQQYERELAYKVIEEQNETNSPPEPNLKQLLKSVDSAYDGEYFKKFPINPVLQHLKEDAYWHSLTDKQKVAYVWMLTDANVRENIFEGERIRRNQFIYGKKSTPERWGFKQDTLRSIMDKFAKDGKINRRVISRGKKNIFTIVTLLSFDVSTHHFTHTFNEEHK